MAGFAEVLVQLDKLLRVPAEVRGGWPLAHVLEHCAQSIEYSIRGYPVLRSAFFRKTVGRLAKGKFLRSGAMSHDCEAPIPGAPPLSQSDNEVAAGRLCEAIRQFQAHPAGFAVHLAYGPCSKEEYEALHAMHIQDHFAKVSFNEQRIP